MWLQVVPVGFVPQPTAVRHSTAQIIIDRDFEPATVSDAMPDVMKEVVGDAEVAASALLTVKLLLGMSLALSARGQGNRGDRRDRTC